MKINGFFFFIIAGCRLPLPLPSDKESLREKKKMADNRRRQNRRVTPPYTPPDIVLEVHTTLTELDAALTWPQAINREHVLIQLRHNLEELRTKEDWRNKPNVLDLIDHLRNLCYAQQTDIRWYHVGAGGVGPPLLNVMGQTDHPLSYRDIEASYDICEWILGWMRKINLTEEEKKFIIL